MKHYTIIALEISEPQGITEHITASSPHDAARKFSKARASSSTVIIVDILEGHLKSLMPPARYCSEITKSKPRGNATQQRNF